MYIWSFLQIGGESKQEKGSKTTPPPANKPAGDKYEAQEYFHYTKDSYADLIVDMAKARIPQPSAKTKPWNFILKQFKKHTWVIIKIAWNNK